MDLADVLLRAATVFVSVVAGLYAARYLLWRIEKLAAPLSKRTGIPASLIALSTVDARTPHAVLAQLLREGAVEFRHVLQFTFATWPIRVVLMHLRIGVIPVALGALGLLGAVYLLIVYLSSLLGFFIAVRVKAAWPDVAASARRIASINVWRQAASITLKYLAVEAVLLALEAAGLRMRLDWLPLPPEAVAVASVAAVRPTYGIMAAAPLYHTGRVGAVDILIALLAGRVAYMTVYEFPRSAVQFYASIYPPGVAGRITAYTAAVMYATALPALAVLSLVKFFVH
ncbi:MAG: hypothetical protein QXP31_03575 [Pyrobaculum sp.]